MKFKKILIIYISILILLSAIFLLYINSCLIKFEKAQIENYITSIEKDWSAAAKKRNISKYINSDNYEISKYEKQHITYKDGLNKIIKSSTLSHKLNSQTTTRESPIYDIYANDKKIATVSLKTTKYSKKLLGFLTYPEWEIIEVNPELENGLYNYTISAPSTYKVLINGMELLKEDSTSSPNNTTLEDFAKYANLPQNSIYSVNKLGFAPIIQIQNEEGKDVQYTQDGNSISTIVNYYTTNDENDAMSHLVTPFKALEFAEKWSLFLTNDLQGGRHGFDILRANLVDGSYMWKMAYAWATNIDITFTSSHTLQNPAFTNETISNFVIYNDKAFSCDIYLEKNMNVARIGAQTDKMHEKLYFAYIDNSWRLVNMQALIENK